jgi:Zn-finger nucleic acid-binding protein
MSMRLCVKCGENLRPTTVGTVEVDLCSGCGGLWLDHEELQELAELPDDAFAGLRALVRKSSQAGETPYRASAEPQRSETQRLDVPCPACEGGKLTHATVGSIGLEVCSGCAGVFLDAGELEVAIREVRGRKEKLATIAAMARSVTTRGTIGG